MHFRIKSVWTWYHHHVYLFLMTVLLATNLLTFRQGRDLLCAISTRTIDGTGQATLPWPW
jgi:hypothetical protein